MQIEIDQNVCQGSFKYGLWKKYRYKIFLTLLQYKTEIFYEQ